MTERPRLRVTIEGTLPLAIQPAAAEVDALPPPGRGESVTELAPSAEDRAHGRRRFEVLVGGWRFEAVVEPALQAALRERAARAVAGQQTHAAISLRAQIPGRVVRLWVTEGEQVEQGQRLLAIEAMKMENEIRAPQAGVVRDLRVNLEQRVERGDELLSVG